MSVVYQLGNLVYDTWEGPPPPLVNQQVVESVRPGVDGVALALAGRWSQPFDVVLTVYLSTVADMLTTMVDQRAMVGSSNELIYEALNYTTEYEHLYFAMSADVIRMKRIARWLSVDKNFANCYMLETRWRLSPISFESP